MADPDKKKARIAAQQVKQQKKTRKQGERYLKTAKRLDKKAGGMIKTDTKTRTRKAAKVESSRNFERGRQAPGCNRKEGPGENFERQDR